MKSCFFTSLYFASLFFAACSSQGPGRKAGPDESSSSHATKEKSCLTDACERQRSQKENAQQAAGLDVKKSLFEKPIDKAEQMINAQISSGSWFQKTSESLAMGSWPEHNLFFLCNNSLSLVSLYHKDDQKFTANFEKIASHVYSAAIALDAKNILDVFYYDKEKKIIQYQTKFKPGKAFSQPKTVEVTVPLVFFPDLTAGLVKEGFPILYVLMRAFDPSSKDKPKSDPLEILKFTFDEARAYRKNDENSKEPFDASKAKHDAFFKDKNAQLLMITDQAKAEEALKAYSFDWEESAQEAFHAETCPPVED